MTERVSRWDTIILDFDGTLVESVGIKDAAFEELFKSFPSHLDAIMRYHLDHNAIIRFKKFEYIYKNILKLPYTEKVEKDVSQKFSNLVFNKIVKCPYVSGALKFLKRYHAVIPLHLVSVSPEKELNRILKARNIQHYFKQIYSSKWKKVEAIKDIILKERTLSDKTVFIGDTYEDYLAAKAVGIFFIGRNSGKPFLEVNIPLFENFNEIISYMK